MAYNDTLFEMLKEHDRNGIKPFHMPGHKRNKEKMPDINPYTIDITEIDGFDDLHHPTGCIAYAEKRAAELYNSQKTYFLINGCTGGILAAISACAVKGGKILLARNSHKSAYNAVLINRLEPLYVWPDKKGTVTDRDIDDMLKENDDISCVFIMSPTYEGTVSDIRRIADVVHSYGKPLIVDEAHGAHMKFSEIFPESAVDCGADIVIHGIHKTIPSLTQTALLHVNGNIADIKMLEKYLAVYQSSSPSYVLMGAIDYSMSYIKHDGEKDFALYEENLRDIYNKLESLRNLYVLPYGKMRDASKIVVCTERSGISGKECYRLLRERYNIQPEMSAPEYVILMTGVWDNREVYDRLVYALKDIDRGCGKGVKENIPKADRCERVITPYQALVSETEDIELSLAAGKVSAEMIYVYPPGIPFVTAGERISESMIRLMQMYPEYGYELYGMADEQGKKIRVCKNI